MNEWMNEWMNESYKKYTILGDTLFPLFIDDVKMIIFSVT